MTTTTQPAIAAITARLDTIADHDAYDGPPPATPTRRYVCVYDQTGVPIRHKYPGRPGWLYLPVQISVVTRTRDGLRESVQKVRNLLAGWAPVTGATPMVEDGTNPILPEGEGNDIRLTAPLTFHCYLPPEES